MEVHPEDAHESGATTKIEAEKRSKRSSWAANLIAGGLGVPASLRYVFNTPTLQQRSHCQLGACLSPPQHRAG